MALKPGGPPLPGDGSGDRRMPGGRRPLRPANGGVTEDWGKVILRIKEDLPFTTLGLGLVRIRPFRSDLTISEPWDEGDRFE